MGKYRLCYFCAKPKYKSIRGTIDVDWRIDADKFRLDATVPPNTTATVHIPTKNAKAVTINGRAGSQSPLVKPVGLIDGKAVFTVQSGRYQFVSSLTQSK